MGQNVTSESGLTVGAIPAGDRFHAGWPVCCRWRRVRPCGCGGLPGRPMPVGGRAGLLWRKFRRASSSRDRRLV
jgi:hypothetical protein